MKTYCSVVLDVSMPEGSVTLETMQQLLVWAKMNCIPSHAKVWFGLHNEIAGFTWHEERA